MIWASSGCDPASDIICKPEFVNELFETPVVFSIGGFGVTRAILLIFLAAFVAIALMLVAFRKPRVVPTKFGVAMEGLVGFVRDEIAVGIIGPDGIKYFPYLLSLFMFILIGNLFEVVPGINFPITSRMAIPAFLSLVTYLIFVVVGFKKNGFGYLGGIVWPKSVPVALRPLVGVIEFASTFIIRPLTLAVRLFANLVAGHVMLTLLLGSGWVFLTYVDPEADAAMGAVLVAAGVVTTGLFFWGRAKNFKRWPMLAGLVSVVAWIWYFSLHGFKPAIGLGWFGIGMGIFLFEIAVAGLQAYIFTLLSAVYIQTSVHPEH